MSHYIIKVISDHRPDDHQASELLDDHGSITRQADRVLWELSRYGYSATIEKVDEKLDANGK